MAQRVTMQKVKLIQMKANVIFLLLFSIPSVCYSQRAVVDTVRYRFHYATKTSNTESKRLHLHDDEVNVDIGRQRVHCYSRWNDDCSLAYDSVRASGGNAADYLALGLPMGSFEPNIIKNYPTKGKLTNLEFCGKDFIYTEPVAVKEWILEEGDTTIVGYPCKKASCTFRGRSWRVWYTPDIPISEGPWKLDGLPGMILMAVDSKGQFSFECIGVKSNVNQPMTAKISGRIKTTPVKLERLIKLKWADPEAYKKVVDAKWKMVDKNGKPVVERKHIACLLEYYEPKN